MHQLLSLIFFYFSLHVWPISSDNCTMYKKQNSFPKNLHLNSHPARVIFKKSPLQGHWFRFCRSQSAHNSCEAKLEKELFLS